MLQSLEFEWLTPILRMISTILNLSSCRTLSLEESKLSRKNSSGLSHWDGFISFASRSGFAGDSIHPIVTLEVKESSLISFWSPHVTPIWMPWEILTADIESSICESVPKANLRDSSEFVSG
jgi:hypothetical protein